MSIFSNTINTITGPIKNMFGGGNNADDGKGGPPAYDEDQVAMVDKEFKRRQDERRPFELQWRLNLCFLEGQQYLDINTASWALEEMPQIYDWQEREAFNQIAPNVEARQAKLKRVRSLLGVRPGTGDQADLYAAKIGKALLRQNYIDQRLQDKQAEELMWLESCGTVIRKHIWNPNLGAVIGYTEDGQEVREGAQEIIVVPPQEIYPDSCYCSGIDKVKSIIHARAFDVDDIEAFWGVKVAPEKAEVEKLARTMNGMGGLGYGQGGFSYSTIKLEHHAIVKEYQEIPTKRYPQGRLIIVAGGKLLYSGGLPYMVAEDGAPGIPFSMCKDIERPGIFWGKAIIERLIPVQRRYNALRNRKAEYLNRCAIGQWSVEEGAVDMDDFERNAGYPGAIHEHKRSFAAPQMIDNPTLPQAFETEEQTLLNEFSILSGVSEMSRQSAAPTGIKAGVALAMLQEQDDTRLSSTAENIERFNVHSGKIQLRLFKQFVTAPRTLSAVGRNNVAEVMDWQGSDIRSEDVILENTSAMAESPAQKRQMVFDLLQSGLLNDPETRTLSREQRSKALEMIEFGEWESADDEDQLHISKAERENRQLEQGQMPQAVEYDDHLIHISRHDKFRLTTDYEELKAKFPVIEQVFDAHKAQHLMFVQQRMLAAMMNQAAQQPQPGQEGGGEQERPEANVA